MNELKKMCIRDSPNTAKMLDAVAGRSLAGIAREIKNVFEEVCSLPETGKIKEDMLCCGALAAGMTGSGSAVFGLFDESKKAFECRNRLEEEGLFTCCCPPCRTGPYEE